MTASPTVSSSSASAPRPEPSTSPRPLRLTFDDPVDPVLPYPISQMNLSNWYRGGYQDWLKHKLETAARLDSASPELAALVRLTCNATH